MVSTFEVQKLVKTQIRTVKGLQESYKVVMTGEDGILIIQSPEPLSFANGEVVELTKRVEQKTLKEK